MIRGLILLCLLALTACSSTDYAGVLREHVSQSRLEEIAAENGGYRYAEQKDFALWEDDSCRVYLLHPELYASDNEYTYWLGHAVRHCFDKDWHEVPLDLAARGTIPGVY